MQTLAAWGFRAADEASTSEIGPGLTAFAIVVLLAIATFLLIRSMLHHIRKVPPTFETDDVPDSESGDGGSNPNVG